MWLRVWGPDGRDEVVPVVGTMTIGSDPHDDVVLAGDGVAPRQAELSMEGGVVTLSVLAEGPVLIDGLPVSGSVVLEPGREVAVGSSRLSVSSSDPRAATAPPPPPFQQTADMPPLPPPPPMVPDAEGTLDAGGSAKPRRRGKVLLGILALLLVGGGVAAAIVLTRDTTPPETERGTADVSTYGSTATFAFSASEEDSTFECSLDGGEWATCKSPHELQEVAAGEHELRVRATDGAGNLETSPVEFGFEVQPLPAPEVSVGRTTTVQVTLKWTEPPEGLVADGYVVYRGGDEVATLEGTELTFRDVRLTPDTNYRYEVALVEGGEEVASGTASTRTVTPPLRLARVEGDFSIDIRVTSAYGWRDADFYADGKLLQNFFLIELKPKCARGACDVTVIHRYQGETYRGTLVRDGTRYEGSWVAPRTVPNCNGGDFTPDTRITLSLRLDDAEGSNGEWRGTELDGTLRLLAPAQSGCREASVSGTVNADVLSLLG